MAPQMASLSVFPLEKLPDELILHILTYFKLKDLMNCCQTSKRIRRIAQGTIHILPKHIFRPFRIQTPPPLRKHDFSTESKQKMAFSEPSPPLTSAYVIY